MSDDKRELRAAVHALDGARGQLAATVAALRRPTSYPNGVLRVDAIETHMSWVFLTESHAYKLKKPIRTAHLDYSTIDARRQACEIELQLNRRLAPTVYLSVVPLASADGKLCAEGAGLPIDWLVKMRRLAHHRMLDVCIERGTVLSAEVDSLGVTLARFYATAERAGSGGPAYRRRLVSSIESMRASLEQPRYRLAPTDISAAVEGLQRWLLQYGALLEARSGTVVDAHGDLRPEHICLEPEPVVIDCLEFDRELRLLDPVSELSFLALECRRLGAAWIGEQLLGRYAKATGDHAPTALFPFYESHHAVVRAAVAVWHLDDDALDRSDSWRERASAYLRLARQLLNDAANASPTHGDRPP